jgi:putative membrane-bound dehydrogenase-like protein
MRLLLCLILALLARTALGGDANRLSYLEGVNPYYVSRNFAKLTTPQWVGDPQVEAVVVLAIDDMREVQRYERYLRPILNRLKQIDGRAPVGIMSCQVEPDDPHLQRWLDEGLSIEIHTSDHPCPLFRQGELSKARTSYESCVDQISAIPNNRPVAFRTPCCDSLNTLSPRFFTELFQGKTPRGNFLTMDSSVFVMLTSNDSQLPRDLVVDAQGSDRFRRYVPFPSFVNTVFDYPYPFVIGGDCWEFPCIVPSDWEAQNVQQPNNPRTVEDLKRALDAVVVKQGVFDFVFHPHGWIRNDQVVELIDHVVQQHGSKVTFLTFREAQQCIDTHLLGGHPLRAVDGGDNGVRMLDLNHDGYQDVIIGNDQLCETRLWDPRAKKWETTSFPVPLVRVDDDGTRHDQGVRFGVVRADGNATAIVHNATQQGGWHFDGSQWVADPRLIETLSVDGRPIRTAHQGRDTGVRLLDLDDDGCCELIASGPEHQAVFSWRPESGGWRPLPFAMPQGTSIVDAMGRDNGVRFVDVDDDCCLDVVFSNEQGYSLDLFESLESGWSRHRLGASRRDGDAIPMIVRNGTNNGAWFHSRHMWVQNEDTARLPDLVDRRAFNDWLVEAAPHPRTARASLKGLIPRDGMHVELVASEPLIRDPVAIEFGPEGNLWVVEMADYPSGNKDDPESGGRVRVLRDTDGDGVYDASTLFLSGLNHPTSALAWGDGVLITAAPDILYARDDDGDLRADHTEVLYTGFGRGNPQHVVNGLRRGLDNWIYGANGDSGGAPKSVKTGQEFRLGGQDFRIRPDEGRIDPQPGTSQYGRCRDDWGNWFGCANPNPMWQYVLADQYLRRNPHLAAPNGRVDVSEVPGTAPVFPRSPLLERFNDYHTANRFTSACGVMVYRDDLLGASYAGNMFVCEPVHNLVHREVMRREGILFSSNRAADEQQSEFLASTDNWFRPTSVRTGPDGAVWVVDMYRHVIEHPEWIPRSFRKQLDLRAGSDRGRIYRVYPVGKRPRPVPNLTKLSDAELVEVLNSPNGTLRDMAQQTLVERDGALKNHAATDRVITDQTDADRAEKDIAATKHATMIAALRQLATGGKSATARLQALCTLDGLSALKPRLLLHSVNDEHAGVRRHAIRLSEPLLEQSPELGAAIVKRVDDPDPQVQLQLAYSLGAWSDPAAGRALGRLALRYAEDAQWSAAILSSALPNLDSLVATVMQQQDKDPPAALVAQLMAMAEAEGNQQAVVSMLESLGRANEGPYRAWQLTALADLLDLLQRRGSSLEKLRSQDDAALRRALRPLDDMFAFARQQVTDAEVPRPLKLQAMALLGRTSQGREQDIALLAQSLGPQNDAAVQRAALEGLARMEDPAIAGLLLGGWKGFGPGLRSEVLDAIFRREAWVGQLLDALQQGQFSARDIDATHRQQLVYYRNREVREHARKLLAVSGESDRQKVVADHQGVLNMQGDPTRGAVLFEKRCAVCHRLREQGHAVGPDLAALTDKRPESLLTAILDPNRAVESKFLTYTAQTNAGLTHTGMLEDESGTSITLLGQEGKRETILRTELDVMESNGKSLMPEGMEKDLAPGQLADVIAYLRSTAPTPHVMPGNQPAVVLPDGLRTELFCLASNAEIYGSSLRFETEQGNLGYWKGTDDHAVWTIEVPRDTLYIVFLEWACPDDTAGNTFVLEVGDFRHAAKVPATGDWNTYQRRVICEVRLKAGKHRLGIRSSGKIDGCLFDLRSVTLRPKGF